MLSVGSANVEQVGTQTSPPTLRRTWYTGWGKRVGDLAIALLALVILAPLMVVVALAILVTLGRPILFRQERVGRGGRSFTLLKFRTMEPDRRCREGGYTGVDRRQQHKSERDPRHHWLGKALRRTSIDELPQLFNVVRGQMSVIGPRPEIRDVAQRLNFVDHPRHLVRPGMTGLWQVSADRPGYVHDNLDYDERYVANLTPLVDLAILVKTPRALTKGK